MKEQIGENNDDGQPQFTTKTLTNVTTEFFQNEHLFKLMVESAAEYAIFAVDAGGFIVNWNQGAERIFDYGEREIVGKNLAILFSAEDVAAEIPQEEMRKARENGSASDDRWLQKADGSRFWASGKMMALKDDAGDFKGFVKIVRDQTERRQALENLNSSDLRFQEMIGQSPFSTFVQDAGGGVEYVNPAFTRLWGLKLEDLANYNSLEDEQAEALGLKPFIERAFAGEAVEFPTVCYDPKQTNAVRDGNECWIKTFAYPIKDEAGAVVEVVTVHEDVSGKIKTDAELFASRERLRLAQKAGRAGTFEWNIKEDFNVWSAELEELYGVSAGTFEGNFDAWYKRVIKEDADRIVAGIKQALESKREDYDYEFRALLPDGSLRWLAGRAQFYYDAEGEPERMIGINFDIANRKRAEEELRRSREHYEALVLASSQIVWTTDATGAVIEDSPSWRHYTGQPYDKWTGYGWLDALHPDDRADAARVWDEAVERKTLYEVEYRIKNAADEYRWTQARGVPIKNDDGSIREWVGMNIDIHERKQAETILRESEERFRKMADHAPVMIWITEADASCSYLSQSWYEFTGQTPETGLGFGWFDAVHPDDLERSERVFLAANERREGFRLDYRLRRTDGSYAWAIDSAQPRFSEAGEFLGYIGSVIDITDRKQAEAALRESEEKYRTLFETIDEGFCLIEILYDETGAPVDYRFLEVNRVFEEQTGLENATGKSVREMVPHFESFWVETYAEVARTGKSMRFENGSESLNRWFDVFASRVGGDESRVVAVVFKDTTARKRQERQLAFLAEFSQELVVLSNVPEIVKVFGEKVSRLMNVSVCAFVEINEVKDEAVINHEWWQTNDFSLIGSYDLPQFVTGEFFAEMSAGKTVVVRDIADDSRIESKEKFNAVNIGSFINVPLISNGEWKFILGVYHEKPYDWQPDEIALMIEAANRIWTKMERVRGEEALSESHARREFVLESSKIGEWDIDLSTGRTQHTLIHDRCFGAAEPFDEWNFDIFLSYVHADDRDAVKQKFEKAVTEEESFNVECRVVWADESVHWIRAQGSFYRDEDSGKSTRMLGIVTEITEQKQAEEALRASEEFNRSVIASSPDCFKILDIEGRLEFMNDDGFCIMEIDDFEQFKGRIWVDFWQGKEHALATESVEKARRGEVGKFQGFCRTAKGTPKWWDVVVAPVRGARGEIVRLLSISRDITANKRAEQEREELVARELKALKQSEIERQKLESLFKQSPAVINLTRGADHVFELIHPRMPELLGDHDYLGKSVKEVLPEPEYEPFIELMNRVYKTGETYSGSDTPIWLNAPEGRREGYFDFIYQAWREVTGEVGGVMSLGVEVTDRVLARKEMERAAEEREAMLEREQQLRKTAEDASRLKDEFLATVSHELRTPLNAIIGWSQMMRSGVVKADQYDKAIETIDRNARSQAQLIDDLLDITRIITGKLRLNLDETNFASVINSAVQTVRPAAQAKNIQLFVNLSSEQAEILGDAERLQQVVWNLLSNAVKFTPKAGEIFVALEMKGSHLKLSVRDTGEGIEPEFLPFVFDRFSQADMSSTRRMGGLGLGLSIVRHLVEMHGGAVSVSSEGKGHGTIFTVVLPVNIDRQEDQVETARATHYPDSAGNAPTARLDGVKVLVVDDEPDACEVLKILLEQCGAHVSVAGSASEALEAMSAEIPSVLVSDIAMPNEDGYSLIRKIRSLPKEKGGDIPAIALTAYASQTDRKKALEAGFQSHITKPVDQNALVTILASLV